MSRFKNRWVIIVSFAAVGTATLAGFISSGRASEGPAPGLTAGVASLATLPPQAKIPVNVSLFVDSAAAATGTDPARARASVRLLRANVGHANRSVYAFPNANGSPCFLLTGVAGTCARNPAAGTPGLHWVIGGGSKDSPSALVGITSDEVSRVDLAVDGRQVPVNKANNVVYAEFPSTAQEAHVVIHRDDGLDNSFDVHLQG